MKGEFDLLLNGLIEKTDLMVQSLKADDVDVFLEALEAREALISMLSTYEKDLKELKVVHHALIERLLSLEALIQPELENCQDRIKRDIIGVQSERMKLKQNSVKASRYFVSPQVVAGSYFDNKK